MINLDSGEAVKLTVRRHWYALAIESAFLFLLALAPVVGLASLSAAGTLGRDPVLPFALFLSFLWLFVLWVIFFVIWTNYYLDVWILTDKRLIDVEQKHLWSREVAEMPLYRVQDVKVDVNGIIATLLRFGDVHIQTAGMSREFIMRHVPHPDRVKAAVFEQIARQVMPAGRQARGAAGPPSKVE